MIRLSSIVENRPWIEQSLDAPAVYLDTWALIHFAEKDANAGARLREVLLGRSGTVAISMLTFLDFMGMTDPRHAEAAGAYLDTIYPNLFMMQIDPYLVRHAESERPHEAPSSLPACDEDLLMRTAGLREKFGVPMSASLWFALTVASRDHFLAIRDSIANMFLKGIEGLKKNLAADQKKQALTRQPFKDADRPVATHSLIRATLHDFVSTKRTKKPVNDAIDWFQCVVPCAYCQYVLIDNAAHNRMSRIISRMRDAGISAPAAETFSEAHGGIETFLRVLESLPVDNNA